MIDKSNFFVIFLLVIASSSQLMKQGWLASGFNPEVYAGWATAVLASQLFFNFGGLGIHNFTARHAALYQSKGKILLVNNLVAKQLFVYTYLLPVSIPLVYYLVAKPEAILFFTMVVYSIVNVFLNSVTSPIYVKSSLKFANIQAKRGVGSAAVAIATCYVTDSLILTLINESIFIFVLGIFTLKRQRLKWSSKYIKPGWKCIRLAPFLIPVLFSTASVSMSRLLAIDLLSDKLLGIYYFIFLIVSCGAIFQYGLSVFFGPIITSRLGANSFGSLGGFIFKCWAFLVVLALLIGMLLLKVVPILTNYFYADYALGLVLISPILCLAMGKICDIWSIYFLLGGLEKYLYLPHLVSIISSILIFFFIVETDNFRLIDMRLFIFAEAFAVFFVPLFLFLWGQRELSAA